MKFENVWFLLSLALIVPLFGLLVYYVSVRKRTLIESVFGKNADEHQVTTLSKGMRYLRVWLLFCAICLLVVAVARPRWGWQIIPFSGHGRDMMVVLDVSKSMLSEDVKPSRLQHAKLFLRELVKDCPGDRFGLIAFAGSAFLECPLTIDQTSFLHTLDELNTDSIPLGGTNIEHALTVALTAFEGAEGSYRAIVLVTDGDELDGDSRQALDRLKAMKIPIYVVGIGDPAGDGLIKIRGDDGRTTLMRDSAGELVVSKLNEPVMKALAMSVEGGIYVRSTETSPELQPVLQKVKDLVPRELEKGQNKKPMERFHYPLLAAVLLLLVRLGIGERRNGGSTAGGKLKTLALTVFLAAFINGFTWGGIAFCSGTLELGDEIAGESSEHENIKGSAINLYNEALKLHREGDTAKAAELYSKAVNMSSDMPEVRGKAFQNLGVISHMGGRDEMMKNPDKALKIFDRTEELYREAMRSDTRLKKVILNQQKLLDDRVLAQEIKQMQQDMKDKQKNAEDQTQQAMQQQQKENQQQDEQQKDQQRQKTQEKMEEAANAVQELQEEARKQQSKEIEQSSGKALDELEQAKREHSQGKGEKSEEHIRNALEHLGASEKKDDEKDKDSQNEKGEDKDKPEQQEYREQPQSKRPEGEPRESDEARPEEGDIDPAQAEALLELMAGEEKDLRDALRERELKSTRTKKVLRDW
ncbi:MAG: VWA domain-containing protein [Victivallales bacterium]|nr:VWA domain-containing protein [Victivallales bacterium]